jgi:signal peptidase I
VVARKLKNIYKKIGSALSTLALVISLILCLTVVTQVVSNGYVQIGGLSLFRVVTGSMEPELPVGSLLICQETSIQQIQEGDIICFRSRNPQIMGKIITHRVIDITTSGEGELLLETKGDANLSADSEFVTAKNLIGRVNHYAKDGNLMASLVNVLTDRIGFLMLILFPTLLIAGFILRSCMTNMRRDIEEALEEEKRQKAEGERLYTDEEYAAMLERISRELLEEMTQGAEENDEKTAKTSKTE